METMCSSHDPQTSPPLWVEHWQKRVAPREREAVTVGAGGRYRSAQEGGFLLSPEDTKAAYVPCVEICLVGLEEGNVVNVLEYMQLWQVCLGDTCKVDEAFYRELASSLSPSWVGLHCVCSGGWVVEQILIEK